MTSEKLTQDQQAELSELVADCKRRGYTKYATTMEVATEFELYYQRAYYYVRKFWNL